MYCVVLVVQVPVRLHPGVFCVQIFPLWVQLFFTDVLEEPQTPPLHEGFVCSQTPLFIKQVRLLVFFVTPQAPEVAHVGLLWTQLVPLIVHERETVRLLVTHCEPEQAGLVSVQVVLPVFIEQESFVLTLFVVQLPPLEQLGLLCTQVVPFMLQARILVEVFVLQLSPLHAGVFCVQVVLVEFMEQERTVFTFLTVQLPLLEQPGLLCTQVVPLMLQERLVVVFLVAHALLLQMGVVWTQLVLLIEQESEEVLELLTQLPVAGSHV